MGDCASEGQEAGGLQTPAQDQTLLRPPGPELLPEQLQDATPPAPDQVCLAGSQQQPPERD